MELSLVEMPCSGLEMPYSGLEMPSSGLKISCMDCSLFEWMGMSQLHLFCSSPMNIETRVEIREDTQRMKRLSQL